MVQNYFENMAARILQNIDAEAEIDESVNAGPYYFNENFNKQSTLNEGITPQAITCDDNALNTDGMFITAHVEIAAKQIYDAYCSNKSNIQPEVFIYLTDPDILSAISRKTTELHSLLRTSYNKVVAKELIEQGIRKQLKFLAYNR